MCYSAAGKVCVAIMIIVLMIIGLTFLIGGVFPARKHVPKDFQEFTTKTTSSCKTYFVVSGLLALVVCGLAIAGICLVLWWTESRCLFYWLALIVVVTIIIDIMLIVEVEKVKTKSGEFLSAKLPLYGIVLDVTKQIDFYQRKFQCCGVNGPQDYEELGKKIPESCCPLPKSKDDLKMPGPQSYRYGNTARAHPYVPKVAYWIDSVKSPTRKQSTPEPLPTEPTYDEYNMSQGQGDGGYNVNVSTRIGFELPPKNITDGGPEDHQIGNILGQHCSGCYTQFLSAYQPFFFMFYFLVAAKILLQIAVGVSPCWVLLQDKLEGIEERPSDEVSVDTTANCERR